MSGNLFTNKVKIDLDVLGVGVKNEIDREIGCTEVVIVKDGCGGEGKMKLVKK